MWTPMDLGIELISVLYFGKNAFSDTGLGRRLDFAFGELSTRCMIIYKLRYLIIAKY